MAEPLTITAAAPLVRTGELTPSELLEQCLRRIDVYEPAVKAWAYLDRERARRDAERLTDELKRGEYRGPLHGVPVGVKDIIDVFDMPTGCGSKLWANSYARRDATCVERLRQAGAIILGKTVTTAYAYLDPPPTRNPWNLDRTPGGSSSGSAAAVACGMCLAALGTQTGGSLIRPASYCGVACLKPTRGRIDTDGVQPLAPQLDHVGPMAGCVTDLFLIYRCLTRGYLSYEDEAQVSPLEDRLPVTPEDTLLLPKYVSRKLLVDFSLTLDWCEPDARRAFLEFAARINRDDETGFEIWKTEMPSWFPSVPAMHRRVMAVGAAGTHKDRYQRRPDDYPPRIAELIEEGLRCDAVSYEEAALNSRSYHSWWSDDVLVTPATTSFPPVAETTGSPAMNAPWSFLGVPTVSVPVAWSEDGLPFAVQVVGSRSYKDIRCLSVAAAIERLVNLPRRLPPVPA